MSLIHLPHPDQVPTDKFLELVYRKLETQTTAIKADQVDGALTSDDLTDINTDIATLQSQVATLESEIVDLNNEITALKDNNVLVYSVDLPTWNMDSTTSVSVSNPVPSGLRNNICGVYIRIVGDSGEIVAGQFVQSVATAVNLQITFNTNIGSDTITLLRLTGGFLDSTSYDSTSASRGRLYLLVENPN